MEMETGYQTSTIPVFWSPCVHVESGSDTLASARGGSGVLAAPVAACRRRCQACTPHADCADARHPRARRLCGAGCSALRGNSRGRRRSLRESMIPSGGALLCA
eukprot:2293673-Prymnesium_polylepis.2